MEQHYELTAETEKVRLTRQDFDQVVEAQGRVEGRMERVETVLERLAESQTRTEATVQQLAQAQDRTDATVQQLAQAQDRTDATVQQLVQAQARTDATMQQLAQAQDRTDATMQQLAQAQTRTEERVGRLEEGQVALQKGQAALQKGQVAMQKGQVAMQSAIQEMFQAQARVSRELGSLREDIGFGLEDVARLLLPPYLHKHYGIRLEGAPGSELQRRFFPMKDRPADEIDLYGEGWRDGQHAVVLGESKARTGGGVVKNFADVLERVEPLVEGEVWRIMFGYYIHPSAQPVAEERRILLVASYQR